VFYVLFCFFSYGSGRQIGTARNKFLKNQSNSIYTGSRLFALPNIINMGSFSKMIIITHRPVIKPILGEEKSVKAREKQASPQP